MVVFLNGKFVSEARAVVPINDRGFMYGDGLFETVRVSNAHPFRLAQHLERLTRGAAYLKIKLPYTPKEIQHFAETLVAKNKMPESILRVNLTRGPGDRGYTPKPEGTPTLVMTLHAAPPLDPANPAQWSMITSTHKVPASDPLSSFKTNCKLQQIMARLEAEAQNADEALLLNTNGEVAEAAAANLFWIYHDKICTIPTGRGVLPGITRAVILEICQALGFITNKRVIKADALRHSEGIFLSQSARGVISVTTFDGEPVPVSPLAEKIHQTYCEMLAREGHEAKAPTA